MEKFENEVLYGISINGKKPHRWDPEYPSISPILNLEQLYKSVEVIKKEVTYQSVAKIV